MEKNGLGMAFVFCLFPTRNLRFGHMDHAPRQVTQIVYTTRAEWRSAPSVDPDELAMRAHGDRFRLARGSQALAGPECEAMILSLAEKQHVRSC